jgi:lactoylglutathione lyase
MNLEHVALWTRNIESLKNFYTTYFNAVSNEKYTSIHDLNQKYESYFLSFGGDCRLELMQMQSIPEGDSANGNQTLGMTHFSFSMPSRNSVDMLANRLKADGFTIVGEPRQTGDGFYEACVLDPDGNRVEFAALP